MEKVSADAISRVSAKGRLRAIYDEPIDKHLERIGYVMDRAIRIPGTNFRVGLDPILGFFLPVAGDWIASLVSVYVILISIRHGLPKSTIARMVFNVAVDATVGSIPVVGDLFDFAWKSNDKNLRLLNKYATGKRGSLLGDWLWVIVLLAVLFALLAGVVAVALYALHKVSTEGIRW